MTLTARQDARYLEAIAAFGPDIARFAAGYELNAAQRHELLQEIHLALWQSFAAFEEKCSLRTWVYRVAHNVGVDHVQRSLRVADRRALTLDEAIDVCDDHADIGATDRRLDAQRLMALIHRLRPLDREVMLLYLEDLDANTIAEVTGLSTSNVSTKVHRLKALLAAQLNPRSHRS